MTDKISTKRQMKPVPQGSTSSKKAKKAGGGNCCLLPMLKETTFLVDILGFLDHKSIQQLFQVGPVANHFDLKNHYCVAHGEKLVGPFFPKWEKGLLPAQRQHLSMYGVTVTQEEENSEKEPSKQETKKPPSTRIQTRSQTKKSTTTTTERTRQKKVGGRLIFWKSQNPSVNPSTCLECFLASKNMEKCLDCNFYRPWNRIIGCKHCTYRGCSGCASKKMGECGHCDKKNVCLTCDEDAFYCEGCHMVFCCDGDGEYPCGGSFISGFFNGEVYCAECRDDAIAAQLPLDEEEWEMMM